MQATATTTVRKTATGRSARMKAGSPPPALKSARRRASMDAALSTTPMPRTSDDKLWHGIGARRSPAMQPRYNEDLPLDDHPAVQTARAGDYLTPRVRGCYADRINKNLFVVSREFKIAPENTPVESELGIITHTNLEAVAGVVAGELWASVATPWIWQINSGSRRYPLQEALVFNKKKLLWEVPPKGTPERTRLDQQWEAVAAYMLTVGAAVVKQVPLDQRFEENLDFKIFVRQDVLQAEMDLFMRCAPSKWKKLIKQRLQQHETQKLYLQAPQQSPVL